jgi:hypothetical protein
VTLTDGLVIYSGFSPGNKLHLLILRPNDQEYGPELRAIFKSEQMRVHTVVGFGVACAPEDLVVKWDLPDNTCGVFIMANCYLLFRYGARRNRRREYPRLSMLPPFSQAEIDWICQKHHYQPSPFVK